MTQAKPPTIKDVAALAGCAISTVSAALRHESKVKASTREAILKAVRELGYRPNQAAASLAAREFRAPASVNGVPVVYLSCALASQAGPNVRRSVEGAESRARQLGYRFEHVEIGSGRSHRSLCRNLHHRGVAGIILGRTWPIMPAEVDFDWSLFSVVRCARDQADELPVHTVEPDVFRATYRTLSTAYLRGYRRVACALRQHVPFLFDDEARWGALQAVWRRHRIPPEERIPPLACSFDVPDSQYQSEFLSWMRQWEPDCVVGFSCLEHWLLSTAGIDSGTEVGYASLHAENGNADLRRVTGILQDRFRLGVASMELLDQQVRYRHLGTAECPMALQVTSHWQEGCTLPPRGCPSGGE